jgi:hypothetical protein
MQRQAAPGPARTQDGTAIGLVAGVVVLALGTSYLHSKLGGLLYTLNALGYAALAAAIVLPIPLLDRFRWLVRLALLGFTLLTIGGWVLFGARYDMAYLTKAIEAGLVSLLVVSIYRFDGGAAGVLARLRTLPTDLVELVRGGR